VKYRNVEVLADPGPEEIVEAPPMGWTPIVPQDGAGGKKTAPVENVVLWRAHIQGEVVLEVDFGQDGSVAAQATGSSSLDTRSRPEGRVVAREGRCRLKSRAFCCVAAEPGS